MRTSNPAPWYRNVPLRRALITLLVALLVLAATAAVYAVEFVAPTPTPGSELPDATYGYEYGPILFVADGTNDETEFFIDQDPAEGLGTELPAGIELTQVTTTTAQIAGIPTGPTGRLTFAVGVSGTDNDPAGSGAFDFSGHGLTVLPAPLTVTANDQSRNVGVANPELTYTVDGLRLGDTVEEVLSGSLATAADTSSPAGEYDIVTGTLALTPYGLQRYALTFETGTLTVNPLAVPEITWPAPAAITYGTPLGASQLNATASFGGSPVDGTFSYTPAAGTVLPAGTQSLQVVFTPTDTASFAQVTANTTITVNRAPLTVRANNASRAVGAPNPSFTASYSGFVSGDGPADLGGTLSFSTTATTSSPVGTYDIVPSGLTSSNYNITFVNGTLTISEQFQNFLPFVAR